MTVTNYTQYLGGGSLNTNVIFINDGVYFAVGLSRKIRVYSVQTGKTIYTLLGHSDTVSHLCVHPQNDKQFFSCSYDGTIRSWDIENGTQLCEWQIGSPISKIALKQNFDDNSPTFFICTKNTISIANEVNKQLQMEQLVKYEKTINDFCISPDGNIICAAVDTSLHMIENRNALKQVRYENEYKINCLAYNTEKNLIASGDELGQIKLWYPKLKKSKSQLPIQSVLTWHAVGVRCIAFSEDGNYLYSGASEGVLVMWFLSSSKKTFTRVFSPIKNVAINPEQDRYIVVCENNRLHVIDPTNFLSGTEKIIYSLNGLIKETNPDAAQVQTEMTIDPVHKHILVNGTNTLQWYSPQDDTQIKEECIQYRALQFNPSRFKYTKPLYHTIVHIAFSSKGSFFAHTEQYGNDSYNLKFWRQSGENYNLMTVIDVPHTKEITSLRFAPDNDEEICLTTSRDGTAKIWTRNSKYFVCSSIIKYKDLEATYATFSPDGSIILIAFDKILTFWDAKTSTMIHAMNVSKSVPISKVEFISDEHFIVQTEYNIQIFSIYSMKNISIFQFNKITHFAANKFKPNTFVLVNNYKNVILFDISQEPPIKKVVTSEANIKAIDFIKEDELLFLDNDHELHSIDIEETKVEDKMEEDKVEQKVEESEEEEEDQMEEEEVDTKQIRQKWMQSVAVQSKVHQKEKFPLYKFDPEKGVAAWRDLFNAPSHALDSVSNTYQAFMDTFLLKKKVHGEETKNEEEEEDVAIPQIVERTKKLKIVTKEKVELDNDVKQFLSDFASKLQI